MAHSNVARYETLVLAIPEITKDETSLLETQVSQAIKKFKGSVISFERWGKYRLAYPVRKNDYGIYFLTRFEIDDKEAKNLIKDINELFAFKKADVIMRSMTTFLTPTQSLAYQKPESLEDSPSRDIDSFLRENKMEGLLSKEHTATTAPSFDTELEAEDIDLEEDKE